MDVFPGPDLVSTVRTRGAVVFDGLIEARGLPLRLLADELNAIGRDLRLSPPPAIRHPMILDWRKGKKRPGPGYRRVLEVWARTLGKKRVEEEERLPIELWLTERERERLKGGAVAAANDVPSPRKSAPAPVLRHRPRSRRPPASAA